MFERAPIAAEGSLGPFELLSGITLKESRGFHSILVIGGYLYMLGGASGLSTGPAAISGAEAASCDQCR